MGEMTLLVSISASTAALAIEALKPGRRISAKDQVKDIKADSDRNQRRAENAGDPGDTEFMIPATTVSLDMLTADQKPRQQVTFSQVESAYRDLED
ncbi:hypothetical protein [Neorhizobium galegae]|uniref:hypothetical protein n=1 Tax=Neorhizobium galegae TaxID=399 RepID=UPI0006228B3C|nr:hypothetical protein [Neorhizobium galegae]CDZ59563.1 Hypothetical protein NGAL_HAMBI2566_35710 [Neorhizobium galegae bv. orientalis]KAB1125586.1 hypothetical protein F4V90_00200 [Neorhizobium galegae]MCQ1572199.1 hypothetical protein [Neorhizobium galegae]MCQ1805845.1 hypothetical protein [Neorhizobium galegae]MCQ1836708.1 hypothetical protein [Neorhizobium galegae]